MRGARFRIVVTGLALAVLVAAPLAVGLSFARTAAPPQARAAIVATGRLAATTTFGDGSNRTELAWLLPGDRDPAVSPDGRRIAFSSARDGNWELYVVTRRPEPSGVSRSTRAPTTATPRGRPTVGGSRGRAAHRALSTCSRWTPTAAPSAFSSQAPATTSSRRGRRIGDRIAFASNRDGHFTCGPCLRRRRAGARSSTPVALRGLRPGRPTPTRSRTTEPTAGSRRLGRFGSTARSSGASRPALLDDGQPDWSPDGRRSHSSRASAGRAADLARCSADGQLRPLAGSAARVTTRPTGPLAAPSLAPRPEQLLPDLDQRAPSGLVVIGSGARIPARVHVGRRQPRCRPTPDPRHAGSAPRR